MKNVRGAGRKAVISSEEIDTIRMRISTGESIASIAEEYGVSRQALYKRIKSINNQYATIDYIVDGSVATRIELDCIKEELRIENYVMRISEYAFGLNMNPDWDDLRALMERQILLQESGDELENGRLLVQELSNNEFSIKDIANSSNEHIRISNDDIDKIPSFKFSKKDILYSRTDTDGYQLKALSRDRKYFVKSQATIGGVLMNDWAVEVMAAELCEQLGIPCVKQKECEFVYGDRVYKGVYSKNFELDGYTFVSFERLLERLGTSSRKQKFIHLDAIEKMKWCAHKLSEAGKIEYEKTLKYMIDLAVIDCLVGNVDRHTRNFGLFYNSYTCKYEIPLIFDNGMGLFENDAYRDNYSTYDSAVMHVYVSPYGEDPFEMLEMIKQEYNLMQIYPGIKDINYNRLINTPHALEYMERMQQLWQK